MKTESDRRPGGALHRWKGGFANFGRRVRKHGGAGKKLFWVWIAYQSIKGVITLSLIWIPLLMLWLAGR